MAVGHIIVFHETQARSFPIQLLQGQIPQNGHGHSKATPQKGV